MVKESRNMHLSAEKAFKKRIRREMFYRFFCRIPVLILGGIMWFHICSLCQYGRIKKNVPVLFVCAVIFLALFLRFLVSCRKYGKNSLPFTYQDFAVEDGRLTVRLNDYCREISFSDIVYCRWKKEECCLADKAGVFIVLSCKDERREYLKLKLSAIRIGKNCFLKTPVLFGWLLVSFFGIVFVAKSAVPYNGKLAWFLQEMKNTRRVELVHDNLYEDKLSGIMEDIEKKVELPERLCLATSFSLHFKPDGTILSFDTMLKGFDKDGNYVDSYLISYDRNKSDKIRIDLHGIANGGYEDEKDFTMLIEGMEAAPVEQTVGRWKQAEYGILYYGWRKFSSYDENVIYLSGDKEILDTADGLWSGMRFGGYSISVYCPGHEEITPYRYLYLPKEQFDGIKELLIYR